MPQHIVHPISAAQLEQEELLQWDDFRRSFTRMVKGLREPSSAALEQEVEPAVAAFNDAQEEQKTHDVDMF